MKLKKCTKCNKLPKITKDGDVQTVSCKCGPERTVIVTGNRPKESAIAEYNSLMCKNDQDVIIIITIPSDEINTPISISCNAPNDQWIETVNKNRKTIISLFNDFVK